ncbi:MAG: hypothetical protein AAF487_01055 [Bacteroidota bacterium]
MKKISSLFTLMLCLSVFGQDSYLGLYSGLSNTGISGQNYVPNAKRGIYYTGGFNYSLVWKSGFFFGFDVLYEQKGFSTDENQIVNGELFEDGLRWNFDHFGAAVKLGYVYEIQRGHRIFTNALFQYNSLLTSNVEVMKVNNAGTLTNTAIANIPNTRPEDYLAGIGLGYSTSLADRLAGSIELRYTGSIQNHHVATLPQRQGFHTAYQLLVGIKFPLEAKNLCDTCP